MYICHIIAIFIVVIIVVSVADIIVVVTQRSKIYNSHLDMHIQFAADPTSFVTNTYADYTCGYPGNVWTKKVCVIIVAADMTAIICGLLMLVL